MNTAQQSTAIDSFYSLEHISSDQATVLHLLEREGALCDKQIAKLLNWDVSSVNGRRNELFHQNKIQIAYKDKSPYTGKMVIFWKVKEEGQQALI